MTRSLLNDFTLGIAFFLFTCSQFCTAHRAAAILRHADVSIVARTWATARMQFKDGGEQIWAVLVCAVQGISWSSGIKLAGTHFKGVGRSFNRRACSWGYFYNICLSNAYPNKFFKHQGEFVFSWVSEGNLNIFERMFEYILGSKLLHPPPGALQAGEQVKKAILSHTNDCTFGIAL